MTEDMQILTWFLGSEPVGSMLNWPVLPQQVCDSVRSIHTESKRQPADPDAIRRAWDAFSGAVGPTLIGRLLASNEWRDFVPLVEGHGDDWCNVWADDARKVVARVVYSDGLAVNVRFTAE